MSDISNIYGSSYLNMKSGSINSSNLEKSVSGLSSKSSEEDISKAVKSFESYFVEQVIKEMKKSVKTDDGENSLSMVKDLYVDNLIKDMSSKIVDQLGDRYTKTLVDQIKRNYGIEDSNKEK